MPVQLPQDWLTRQFREIRNRLSILERAGRGSGGGGGGGGVTSVNGDTGPAVVLTAGDVGADAAGAAATAQAFAIQRANHTGTQTQSTVTNLVTDLAAKAPLASPTFTGTVGGITKSMVGLGSVDNTSDTAKPVSTAQQTALDLKSDKAKSINAQAGTTYTLVLADADKWVELSNASAVTFTVPPNSSVAFPVGTQIEGMQTGAGQVTITAGAGVTITATPGLKVAAQYGSFGLIKVATDTWRAYGRLSS